MPYKCTLTPKAGGAPVEVKHILDYNLGKDRAPAANGTLGMDGWSINRLYITRRLAVHSEGEENGDLELEKQAAATGEAAYFEGELVYAHPDNVDKPARVLRFAGHICSQNETGVQDNLTQTLGIAITSMDVGDAVFRHNVPV